MTPTPGEAVPGGQAGRPWSLQRALWWTADYVYAARRQLAVLSMPWALGRHRPTPPTWHAGSADLPEVVLLPGVYEHWTFLRPLGDTLAAAGHRVRVIHGLGVNRRGIAETADLLARTLADLPLPPAGRVLVAHSKGGLIGKHLLVKTGAASAAAVEASVGGDPAAAAAGAPHSPGEPSLGVLGLVAVATPFGGARRARLFIDPSIRAFLPGNETIVTLGRETSVNGRIVSVYGPYDPHIPEGSALDGATNVVVPAQGHFRVLASPKTHAAVLDGIRLLAAG
ncbi:esterase/lipase family protein [Microbacterium sp. NPDC057407]|uniref:esterase/lipase family protein n=1 Tax=Microbacterium sp. NPDC057407 TaxID=3346120 RepID=UPI00366D25B6